MLNYLGSPEVVFDHDVIVVVFSDSSGALSLSTEGKKHQAQTEYSVSGIDNINVPRIVKTNIDIYK